MVEEHYGSSRSCEDLGLVWRQHRTTEQQHKTEQQRTTEQEHNSTTAKNGTTAQRNNSTTAQQHNSTTAQSNSTTATAEKKHTDASAFTHEKRGTRRVRAFDISSTGNIRQVVQTLKWPISVSFCLWLSSVVHMQGPGVK